MICEYCKKEFQDSDYFHGLRAERKLKMHRPYCPYLNDWRIKAIQKANSSNTESVQHK